MDYRNLIARIASRTQPSSLGYLFGAGMVAVAAIGAFRGPSRAAAEATNFEPAQRTSIVPPQALVGRSIAIPDSRGTGLEAYTIMTPKGWRGKASVLWDLQRTIAPSDLFVTVTDPSGAESFTHLPSVACVWTPQYAQFSAQVGAKVQGCYVLRPPTGAIEAIQQVLIPMYFGSITGRYQVVSSQDLPRLGASLAPEYTQGSRGPSTIDAARVRISYLQDGRPMQTELSCVMAFSQSPAGCVWGLDHVTALTAPPGLLDRDMGTLQLIGLSLRETPAFMDAVDRVSQSLIGQANVDQAALMQRVAGAERSQPQVSADILDRWQQQNRQEEAIFQNYDAQAVRGVSEFVDPFTDAAEAVPDQYTHVWVNAAGDRIYADSEAFDPNLDASQNWRDEQKAN